MYVVGSQAWMHVHLRSGLFLRKYVQGFAGALQYVFQEENVIPATGCVQHPVSDLGAVDELSWPLLPRRETFLTGFFLRPRSHSP